MGDCNTATEISVTMDRNNALTPHTPLYDVGSKSHVGGLSCDVKLSAACGVGDNVPLSRTIRVKWDPASKK